MAFPFEDRPIPPERVIPNVMSVIQHLLAFGASGFGFKSRQDRKQDSGRNTAWFFSWSKQLWPSYSFFCLDLGPIYIPESPSKSQSLKDFWRQDSSDGTAMGQLMPKGAATNISALPQFPLLHNLERLDPTRCPQMKTFSPPLS
ncbi:hypothetical protein JTE90_006820 [Oedothorax gibbosus]|uniref:Uncharacterized protein n=1 Tax=Oedothorax gibbosus TaxID=931172 RepID=A0AAV6TPR4_9ARAC|nr:hypothetical protein JTE90_006820 [Oedothorax gibbosus]